MKDEDAIADPPPADECAGWRVRARTLVGLPERPTGPALDGEVWHPTLTLTAGLSLAPVRADLHALDGALDPVTLAVANGEPGLTADELARVFEPFAWGPAALATNPGGVGPGLAVARQLAVALDGELSATSRPGEMVFTLTPDAGVVWG